MGREGSAAVPTSQPEMIAVHGFLNRAGQFRLRRCYSTHFVRRSPVGHDGYMLEAVDHEGRILQRSFPEVVAMEHCHPEGVRRWKVTGYIGAHERAAAVRLRTNDTMLWQQPMLPQPMLEVALDTDSPSRDHPLGLHLRYSEPGPGAYVQLVYQWGERQFQVIGYGAPASAIPIDLGHLPGGERCRLVVHYSNGMRSAGAATRPFTLRPRGPWLAIVSPGREGTFAANQPLELVGQLVDDERPGGAVPERDLEWWLDDESVGRGSIACVQSLPPGLHTVRLLYRPKEASAEVRIHAQ